MNTKLKDIFGVMGGVALMCILVLTVNESTSVQGEANSAEDALRGVIEKTATHSVKPHNTNGFSVMSKGELGLPSKKINVIQEGEANVETFNNKQHNEHELQLNK
jgi:hypothetical protein